MALVMTGIKEHHNISHDRFGRCMSSFFPLKQGQVLFKCWTNENQMHKHCLNQLLTVAPVVYISTKTRVLSF